MAPNSAAALILLAILAACATPDAMIRDGRSQDGRLNQIVQAPPFVAIDGASADVIADAAVRFAAGRTEASRGVRPTEAAAAPLLFGSPEGRAFLAEPGPRAFVIGAPARSCPARAAAAGADLRAAARGALGQCLAMLPAPEAGAAPECGCVIAALGDSVLAPPEALAYAPGVSARISAPDFELERYLVSGELAGEDGERILTFRSALPDGRVPDPPEGKGPLVAAVWPDGHAEVLWRRNGDVIGFAGRRVADGLRRGRYAERLYVADEEGRRMIVLIGYEPVEYAVRRRELLTWPLG